MRNRSKVTEFLTEREGAPVVGRVARELLDGRTMPEILHSDTASLEREWRAWLTGR